jgi:hypothetical protein
MLSMEDYGDCPSPPSSPSASDSFSCDEAGSDLDRYCSANSVLERSSFSSSMGYHASDFFEDTIPSLSRSNSNSLSPTLRPSNGEDSISISGDDCTDHEVQSNDDSPRSLHGMNGFPHNQHWHRNENQNPNHSSGVERGSERRSSILMDSSVAFGSDDWDEFMLERGDGSGESAPAYLFEMESIRSKEQPKLSSAEPGCNKEETNQEQVQLSDVKQKEPNHSAEHPPTGSSGGNSGSHAGEKNQLTVAKDNESNGNSSCESLEKKDEGIKVCEHLESLNGKCEGKEIEDRHDIMMAGDTYAEFEMEPKGIDQVFVIYTRTDKLIY